MKDTDRNYYSVADCSGRTLERLDLDPAAEGEDAAAFDDILKFSHATRIRASKLRVAGGTENAVDMNRECRDILLENSHLMSGDVCAVVIKGGSEGITLSHVSIGPGRKPTAYDIELGGWSDQSMAPTRRVILEEVWRIDGEPVRVVVGRAERPTVYGGKVRVLFWRSLALKAFWTVRFLANKWRNKQ